MTMERAQGRTLELALAGGFVLLFLWLGTGPVADGDFFWHVHAGRQILADRALPDRDLFSFTTEQVVADQAADPRISVVLGQYWLAQLVLALVFDTGGAAAIVVLRAAVFTALLLLLYLWGRQRAPWPVSGCLTVVTAGLLLEYPSERPQLFSFLLAAVVLFLLERLRGEKRWRSGPPALCLPLLMLLWGNLHGGYLLGVGFCLLYAAGHLAGTVRTGGTEWRYLALLVLSAGTAFVNPCGADALTVFRTTDSGYLAMVYETLSPFAAFRHGDHFWPYWLALLLAAGAFVRSGRGMAREQMLVVAGVLALSLTGLRYMIFLPLSFPLFIAAYAAIPSRQAAIAALLALAAFLAAADFSAAGRFAVADRFPHGAVDFLREKFPARRLFNHYDWGGYLGFALPQSRVFIDGRGLVPAVAREYGAIKDADGYRERLRRYGVDAIVMPALGGTGGKIYPLIRALHGDDAWQLVYWDETALVLVPAADPAARAAAALDKRDIFRHVVRRIDFLLPDANRGERLVLLQTRAESQLLLGDYAGARATARAMQAIETDNRFAARLLAAPEPR